MCSTVALTYRYFTLFQFFVYTYIANKTGVLMSIILKPNCSGIVYRSVKVFTRHRAATFILTYIGCAVINASSFIYSYVSFAGL